MALLWVITVICLIAWAIALVALPNLGWIAHVPLIPAALAVITLIVRPRPAERRG
jgi:hypothetical protein